jgi:hypothetical protein
MFTALVSFIRMRSASPALRDRVVLLLAQLLSAPKMFNALHLPELDVLDRLEDIVMQRAADMAKVTPSSSSTQQ